MGKWIHQNTMGLMGIFSSLLTELHLTEHFLRFSTFIENVEKHILENVEKRKK